MAIDMKVKIATIEKNLIILLLMMQLSYFKLFANVFPMFAYSFWPKPLQMFYFVVVLIIVVLGVRRLQKTSKAFWVEIICCVLPVVVNFLIEVNNGFKVDDLIGYILPFEYILLAIPILGLLKSRQWKFDTMIKTLIILTIGSLLIRMIIVFYYSISGVTLLPNIALESAAKNWIRAGRLRVNPSSTSILLIPMSYYWILRYPKKKMLGIVGVAVGLIYPIYATQARSMMVYGIATMLVMYLSQNVPNKRKLLRYIFIIAIFVFLVSTDQFNTFLDSFSESNKTTGGSTSYRLSAIAYYGGMFLKNPIWGNGFMRSSYSGQIAIGHITDIGIIGALYRVGVSIGVFYLIIVVTGLKQILTRKNEHAEMQLLILGLSITIMLSEINVDCFIGLYAFSMPFVIAIIEYYKYIRLDMVKHNGSVCN